MNDKVLRLIDANFNRSREGLRVCEDIARFLLDSPELTKKFKAARHSVTGIIKDMPIKGFEGHVELTDFRDVIRDVGMASTKTSEMTRHGCRDIFIANIERAKESIRVLEEFLKLIDRKKSGALSRLRFRLYDMEKISIKQISSLNEDF